MNLPKQSVLMALAILTITGFNACNQRLILCISW